MEKLFTTLLFFWDAPVVPFMVHKNLVAHRVRNRKTTIMYALSVGFIIFITVAYSTEIQTAKYNSLKQQGSALTVSAKRGSSSAINASMVSGAGALFAPTEDGSCVCCFNVLFYRSHPPPRPRVSPALAPRRWTPWRRWPCPSAGPAGPCTASRG